MIYLRTNNYSSLNSQILGSLNFILPIILVENFRQILGRFWSLFLFGYIAQNILMKKWIAPFLLCFVLFSCKTKPLEYISFDHFKVVKLGFPNSTIGLNVTCYNPNKFGLTLNRLESDVYINKEFLGKAILDSSISVPRMDTFFIPVKMDVKMGGTMNSILQLMNSSADSTTLLIKLDGKARVKKGGLVINYPISYEEMKVLKF